MNLEDLSLSILRSDTNIKNFDCDDHDLNEFLLDKAKDYSRQLLTTTYVIESEDRTIAYFSIFNDSIRIEDLNLTTRSLKDRFLKAILPHRKRHLSYFPAIKIGRLGVCKLSKGCGLGKQVVHYIISIALDYNERVACKFLTVDAYAQSIIFYEKMGFKYFSDKDKGQDTRQMYFDLTPLINLDSENEIAEAS